MTSTCSTKICLFIYVTISKIANTPISHTTKPPPPPISPHFQSQINTLMTGISTIIIACFLSGMSGDSRVENKDHTPCCLQPSGKSLYSSL